MLDLFIQASDPAVIDHASAWIQAQDLPGQGGGMEAPPGFSSIADRIVSGAKWIGIFVCIIAVIVAFAGAAISRQRGNSEEATSQFLTISLAVAGITGAVGIISWLLEAAVMGG